MLTVARLTRYDLATSFWFSKETKVLCKMSSFSSRRRGPRFFDLFLFPGATTSSKSGLSRSCYFETGLYAPIEIRRARRETDSMSSASAAAVICCIARAYSRNARLILVTSTPRVFNFQLVSWHPSRVRSGWLAEYSLGRNKNFHGSIDALCALGYGSRSSMLALSLAIS